MSAFYEKSQYFTEWNIGISLIIADVFKPHLFVIALEEDNVCKRSAKKFIRERTKCG